jgi:hypothetical protein
MNSKVFMMVQCILAIGLMAILVQAGITLVSPTFWAVVAVADAMALVGFLWGNDI